MKVETTIDVAAPPERLFAVLMDPERLEDWVTMSRSVEAVPADGLAEGSTFKQKLRLAAVDFEVTWTIKRLNAPRLAEWEGRGPSGTSAYVLYELEEIENGTRFHYVNELELPAGPAGKVAGRLASKPAKKSMEASLEKLCGLVEGQGEG